MNGFREKLEELKGKDIHLKAIENTSDNGKLREVGENYLLLEKKEEKVLYNLKNIVSIKEVKERNNLGIGVIDTI